MHVMEDVREGSDVPGAQPSSPGHAEQRPNMEESDLEPSASNENCVVKLEEKIKVEPSQTNGTDDATTSPDTNLEEEDSKNAPEKEESVNGEQEEEDGDSQYSKRKAECDESPSKRLRSELEQNFILRDKILNDYVDTTGCSSVEQIQGHMDQILGEIRTLNELAREKEKEWNNLIHLKKMKEELLLRIQRRKQIMIMNNDESMDMSDMDEHSLQNNRKQQSLLKHNLNMNNNSGLVIYSTSKFPDAERALNNKQKHSLSSKQSPNTIIEINGQSGDPKLKQRPVKDVQSIIADFRQRHPEDVPRRGRRIRTLLHSQGSGSQVKHNSASSGIETNTELGILLNAVDNTKSGSKQSSGDGHIETTSFKDVLMQFAKLSQNERQDLLQNAMKPLPYSEVTVHPIPAPAQTTSNSLLHGILTKTQARSDNSKSTFSPTLARLLTAPERAASNSPHTPNNHNNVPPVSINDMLSNNKARSEITITPVVTQFDLMGKEKGNEEEEAEDSADRLVIDESEALDGRNRMDNGSDAGDDVPQCQGCNQKPAQFVCAGCGNQWYCSRECQVVAWDEHSEVCSG